MTAPVRDLVARVQAAGGSLLLDDGELFVEAPTPLPDELVSELSQAKPALIQHLRCDGWDATDWWALYQERIAIAEHDGGLSAEQAMHQAFEDCMAFWLHRNPPLATEPEHCAHCHQSLGRVGAHGIPVLAGENGHVWLHDTCWNDWMVCRRTEAGAALAAFGVERPE
jgi:hypothetical protein